MWIERARGWENRATWLAFLLGFAASLTVPGVFAQEAISTRGGSRDSPVETVQTAATNWGIEFPVAFTTEILGNLSGGTSRAVIWESLLNVGLAVDLEKAVGWTGASLSVRAIYPQGFGLTDAAVHDFNTLSNIDSYDSLRLYDAWLEQEFDGGKFSIRAGQLLADAEFFNSDYATLFINSSFGAIPLVSQNLNPPIFPTAAPGVRLRAAPNDSFYAETAIFSGDTSDPTLNNKHNTRLSFRSADGALVFAEIGYIWNPKPKKPAPSQEGEPSALTGTYKLGGYYDSKEFEDSAGGSPHRGDYSLYFVVDQELWHPGGDIGQTLSLFTRGGAAPNDRNTVVLYGDIGFNYKGFWRARNQDTLGMAFSYAQLSRDLVNDLGRHITSHHEAVLELTYQAPWGSHLNIQPDLQFIFNPGAVQPAPTAVVAGLRLNLQF